VPMPKEDHDNEKVTDTVEGYMWVLFCQELERQGAFLEEACLALEDENAEGEEMEKALRSAHSIKGAARLVHEEHVVELAHEIEDALTAMQKKKRVVERKDIDIFLRCIDVFIGVARVAYGSRNLFVETISSGVDTCKKMLKAVKGGRRKDINPPDIEKVVFEEAPSSFLSIPVDHVSTLVQRAGELFVTLYGVNEFSQRMYAMRENYMKLSGMYNAIFDVVADSCQDRHDIMQHMKECKETFLAGSEMSAQMIKDMRTFGYHAVTQGKKLYTTAVRCRSRPFGDEVRDVPRMLRDMVKKYKKKVSCVIRGRELLVDRDVLEALKAPLCHLVRNVVDHGVETAAERVKKGKKEHALLEIEARYQRSNLCVTIRDDGKGVDEKKLRRTLVAKKVLTKKEEKSLSYEKLLPYIFSSGVTTASRVTEISGRGVGLDVVKDAIEKFGGEVTVTSEPGVGTAFVLSIPLSFAILHALIVTISGELYAFPSHAIDSISYLGDDDIVEKDGMISCLWDGEEVAYIHAAEALGTTASVVEGDTHPVLFMKYGGERYGVAVDAFEGEQEIILRELDPRLRDIVGITSAALLEDGSIALVVDGEEIVVNALAGLGGINEKS
jgi:two-component system, chemotaxis family, sensor histidine kinase and response regulator WspE